MARTPCSKQPRLMAAALMRWRRSRPTPPAIGSTKTQPPSATQRVFTAYRSRNGKARGPGRSFTNPQETKRLVRDLRVSPLINAIQLEHLPAGTLDLDPGDAIAVALESDDRLRRGARTGGWRGLRGGRGHGRGVEHHGRKRLLGPGHDFEGKARRGRAGAFGAPGTGRPRRGTAGLTLAGSRPRA